MKSGIQEACVYPDRADLVFRDQNTHAARQATEKWRSRSTRNPKSPESSVGSPSSSSSTPRSVPGSLEDLAIARFYFDWTLPRDTLKTNRVSFLEFIPDLYSQCQADSLLSKAVKAVAFANFAQRYQVVDARHNAIQNCTEALSMLHSAMENPDKTRVDETLSSIILLGIYEVRIVNLRLNFGSESLTSEYSFLQTARSMKMVLGLLISPGRLPFSI